MQSTDVVIEHCKSEHVNELVELWKEYMVDQVQKDPLLPYFDLEASNEGFRKIIDGFLEKEPEGFFVARFGDRVVGFVASYKDAFGSNYRMKTRVGHIQVVHVRRGFRRRGIATRLVEAAMRYLKDNKCTIMLAETGEMNKEAIQMFEKLGFKQRGRLVALMKKA